MANFLQKLVGSHSEPTPKQSVQAQQPAPQKSATDVLADANRMLLLLEVLNQAKLYGDAATVKAVNDMTYDGPLPEQLPDGSFTRIYELQDYNIAGINYRENVSAYLGDFEGYLKPDPENEHDPNAIAVYSRNGHHLGFIPAACTDHIRALGRPFPMPITGNIDQEHDDVENRYYFVGTVYIYALKK